MAWFCWSMAAPSSTPMPSSIGRLPECQKRRNARPGSRFSRELCRGQYLLDRLRHLAHDLVKLVISCVIGRRQDDDIAVHSVHIAANRIADQSVVERLLADAHEELVFRRKGLLGL